MTSEQITCMKSDDVLLLVGNRNLLKAKQNIYFKSKAYRGRFYENLVELKAECSILLKFSRSERVK